MNPNVVEALEETRARRERGEEVDLGAYRDRLGSDWEQFRDLYAFHSGFSNALESGFDSRTPQTMGHYTVLRELGRGAMGVVYEARDTKLDRVVALKTLRPDVDAGPELIQRYEREARNCAQVRHPHLIEIYEVGEHAGRPYYAMPLLSGGPLSRVLREGPPLTPAALCKRMADVADAVEALHRAKIVHRDIKPANIVVEEDGRFVLADFGLARRMDLPALTSTGQIVGTPHYMSPEQLRGNAGNIDARTDIYSIGASLYEALAQRLPFEAGELESLYARILTKRPQALQEVAPSVSRAMERVVMKCLEKRPEDRYGTAGKLAADLRAAAAGNAVAARRISPVTRLLRTVRPRHVVFACVLIGTAVWALLSTMQRAPASGESHVMAIQIPADGKLDLDHYLTWAKKNGFEVKFTIELEPASRNSTTDPMQLVFPRGRVRLEDLDKMRIDVTEAFEDQGDLVFRQDDTELARVPFKATSFRNEPAVPQAVRDAARQGAVLTWAFEPTKGATTLQASFEVVAPDLSAEFARVDEAAAVPNQPAELAPLLRGMVLLDQGLAVAAFRAVAPLRKEAVGDDSLAAVRLQAEALRRAYGDDAEALEGADPWQRIALRLEDLGAR